ncbi:YqaJ viral recombinase family protein [Streptomyces sp. NPDC048604]|uniref:YqaJ viral recombinase family nuclease n=1 Tax=Streptomyces sp. NPDC048604 TaxID=3365578 RepID=UPI00371E749B
MTLNYPSGAQIVLGPDASADEWHAVRATGIGGSDIAAICGLNPYTSPLEIWLKKRGETVPRRHDPILSEAAEMGHELEPVVARRFAKATGLPVIENPGTLRHPGLPHMLVNLDRATVEPAGDMGAVELKTRSSYALPDWIDETPVEVQVQVQWQLAVTGWRYAWTAALIGGQRTIVHRIDRDQQLIDDLIAIGSEFWGWVQTGTQPPLDGSHATGELLDRLHATPVDQIVVADPTEVEKWLKIRATAKEQAEAADIALTEAENHLKAIAGNATDVHIRGELAYSWRPRRGSIHWKDAALAADPDIDAEQYRGEPTRVFNVHLENL